MFQMIRHRVSVRHIGIWRRVAADNACSVQCVSSLPYELLYDCHRQSLIFRIRCAEHHPLGIVAAEQLDKLEFDC